jgi:hypothetical protein
VCEVKMDHPLPWISDWPHTHSHMKSVFFPGRILAYLHRLRFYFDWIPLRFFPLYIFYWTLIYTEQ